MILALSMRLPSVANLRDHWATKARRTKAQRLSVALAMLSNRWALFEHREALKAGAKRRVTFIRVAPRPLDDDNLAGAFKGCRDEVAKQLGTTDGPSGPISWRYEQRKPLPGGTPGIMILIGGKS